MRLVLVERRNCEVPLSEVSLFEIIYALAESGWTRTEEERNGNKIQD